MSLAQTYKDIKRLKQIANVLFKKELGYFVNKLDLKSHLSLHKKAQVKKFIKPQESLPQRVRESMEELGGSFVKLGQLLSIRPDLIPEEYIEEFKKLQDSVKPFPFNQVQATIESEFKKPITQIFSHFNKTPIASASVGQVHEARLKTGERVAVKVQRPKIKELFMTDIDIMHHLAHLIEKHIDGSEKFNPVAIVQEFEKYTKRELDYIMES
ncbi:MAG: AarF/UbiB family protein, partial [Nanoarchaeota archaeon]|nr:AarF/UbiB family protein [Nanoarchaeota archaeon]